MNVNTVLAYLNNAGNAHRTCAELVIHRTTVYDRLERVRSIVGDVLDSGWTRTSLHAALLVGEIADTAHRD